MSQSPKESQSIRQFANMQARALFPASCTLVSILANLSTVYILSASLTRFTSLMPLSIAAIGLITGSPHLIAAEKAKRTLESKDRDVDAAALDAQKSAIRSLESYISKQARGSEEPKLKLKLAELYQQQTELLFRVTHARPTDKTKAAHIESLNKTHQILSFWLDHFLGKPDTDRALFMRAKTNDELEKGGLAALDYESLIARYPGSSFAPAAHFSLADMAIEKNLHVVAISHLEKIKALPDHPLYPLALYRLGWSKYNLGLIPEALSELETHVAYFKAIENLEHSDQAFLENTLQDIPLFYLDGVEKFSSDYKIEGSYRYFSTFTSNEEHLAKMTIRFARLLRAHNHFDKLEQLTHIVPKTKRETQYGLMQVQLEAAQTGTDFGAVAKLSRDLIDLKGGTGPTLNALTDQLLVANEWLRDLLSKNKKAKGEKTFIKMRDAFIDVGTAFATLVPDTDGRGKQARLNMAETLFDLKEYQAATLQYLSVGSDEAKLKAIGARYEELKSAGVIATELKVVHLDNVHSTELSKAFEEWHDWISAQPASSERNAFLFQSIRTIYQAGQIRRAITESISFVRSVPDALETQAFASLVIDTFVKSSDKYSEELLSQLKDLRSVKKAQFDDEFRKKMFALEADVNFKLLSSNSGEKTSKDALIHCMNEYKGSPRAQDCKFLLGREEEKSGNVELASKIYSQVVEEKSSRRASTKSLIAKAKIEEAKHHTIEALELYRNAYTVSAEDNAHVETTVIEQSALLETILSLEAKLGLDPAQSKEGNTDGSIFLFTKKCFSELSSPVCDNYIVHYLLNRDPSIKITEAEWSKLSSVKIQKDNPVDAFARQVLVDAHKGLKTKINKDDVDVEAESLRSLIDAYFKYFKSFNEREQATLIFYSKGVLLNAFNLVKEAKLKKARLYATPKAIERRIQTMTELAEIGGLIISLAQTRAHALLHEVAFGVPESITDVYARFRQDLKELPIPRELEGEEKAKYLSMIEQIAKPFVAKEAELKAIEASLMKLGPNVALAEHKGQVTNLKTRSRSPASSPDLPASLKSNGGPEKHQSNKEDAK